MKPFLSPAEVVSLLKSNDQVYIGSNCGPPVTLCQAMTDRSFELSGVTLFHLLTFGSAPYVAPGLESNFRHVAFFVAGNTREAVQSGRADYIPVFLSDIPHLFDSKRIPLDAALIAVTLPNEDGFCSLGVSVDLAVSACRNAKTILAEVQPQMPWTNGPGKIHCDQIDAWCLSEHALLEHPSPEPDLVSHQIAGHIRELVRDGMCIQTGFGKLPSAVLEALSDLNDLGIHTEMFSDEIVNLVENGNVNNSRKAVLPGRSVSTFALGTRRLFDVLDNNPAYEFHPTEVVNDPSVIAQNDNVLAINSAIEVDLTGQVVADCIGSHIYSGIGGQVDFIRGASRSKGGVPIIALPSTARSGSVSRIVRTLSPGAGVATSRADVHWVVTEYGAVNLHGSPLHDRSAMLAEIAHPDFRDELRG